ncbi:MAG TPA: hypothetical protein DHW22_00035 [Planctomycetaceae bacterium]|nr:hypothetical protein [Planctomycetaceae bacterium]
MVNPLDSLHPLALLNYPSVPSEPRLAILKSAHHQYAPRCSSENHTTEVASGVKGLDRVPIFEGMLWQVLC